MNQPQKETVQTVVNLAGPPCKSWCTVGTSAPTKDAEVPGGDFLVTSWSHGFLMDSMVNSKWKN